MIILPAIDIMGGRAVRLTKGDYAAVRAYSDSPILTAREFAAAGAKHLHIVDLDGAKSGRTENGELISRMIKESGLTAEVGGGIRDLGRVEYYLSAGAARVIIGTAALKNEPFLIEAVARFGEAIAVGADLRDGFVAVDGWTETGAVRGEDFIRRMRELGVRTVIVTDISRDGMLAGTNLELYRSVIAAEPGLNVIASGGITSPGEVTALRDAGAYGAILGKALYEGRLDLKACLAANEGGRK